MTFNYMARHMLSDLFRQLPRGWWLAWRWSTRGREQREAVHQREESAL